LRRKCLNGGRINCPATITLGISVAEKQGAKAWDSEDLKHAYLHELGHAILEGQPQATKKPCKPMTRLLQLHKHP